MDYPGVVAGEAELFRKIDLAASRDKRIDGHGPGIDGLDLNGYRCAGITTEHECSTRKEMEDRLSRGMHILIREGSAARNLETLVGGVNPLNSRRCLFCTDDKQPADILTEGHIDHNIRRAVELGLDPVTAVRMATLNAAECYGLRDRGAVAPGYRADLVVVDDLSSFHVKEVYKDGRLAAREGKALFSVLPVMDETVKNTIHLPHLSPERFVLNLSGDFAHVILLNGHSLVTGKVIREVPRTPEGHFRSQPGRDILKLSVIERHGKTGNQGLALVENYGLKGGAAATTIAHDSHNLIVIGDSDTDMAAAANALIDAGGGMVLVRDGRVLELLPLPLAGLMSDEPVEVIRDRAESINRKAWDLMGVNRDLDPFMTLAFMSLPVIPELKLTARGLFDVTAFQFIPLCPES
jgi:adenine deaminase